MKNVTAQEIPNGRWKKAEHDRFLKGLEKYGRDWVKVQKIVKSRSLAQVRSHAQKCFKNMSSQDIQAYFSEDKDYACTSFGRIKMNRQIILEHPIPSKEVPYDPLPLPNGEHTDNLLEIFKKALESEESSCQEKMQQKNTTKKEISCNLPNELSTQLKGSALVNPQETQISGKNPFSDKINNFEQLTAKIASK